jgi:PhnB protein
MVKINLYLNFKDNTEEAFKFYKSIFGGEFTALQRFKDTPDAAKIAKNDQEKIMHIALPVGNTILMGTDAPESMGFKLKQGDNFSISVDAESKKEADALFAKLSKGGKSTMPMADMFWGSYFGMLTDKFGVQWMVSYNHTKKE